MKRSKNSVEGLNQSPVLFVESEILRGCLHLFPLLKVLTSPLLVSHLAPRGFLESNGSIGGSPDLTLFIEKDVGVVMGLRHCQLKTMWTRRNFLRKSIGLSLTVSAINSFLWKFVSSSWAKVKQILPKDFPKNQMVQMNPAEIDNRNLEIDSLNRFGTMGPTHVAVDIKTYRLKISGKVKQPLILTYDEILKYPSLTETVLLICPGFFANNGRWTGLSFRTLLGPAKVHPWATYVEIKGAYGKVVKISLKEIDRKKIFLAYLVNGETLPQKHGFPLRLVYEDAYGYDWVKYVEEIVIS